MNDLRKRLEIPMDRLDEINQALTDPDNELVSELLAVVESYGGPEEINRKAAEARKLENLMARLKEEKLPYFDDVQSLMEQCDKLPFVSMDEYYARVLGDSSKAAHMNQQNAVTLEISALQYFPWLISEAKRAIEKRELMPGRYIRVRSMA